MSAIKRALITKLCALVHIQHAKVVPNPTPPTRTQHTDGHLRELDETFFPL